MKEFREISEVTLEEGHIFDYNVHLETYQFSYKRSLLYYHIGDIKRTQGWILHVSILPIQVRMLLERVLPCLAKYEVSFKIIRNSKYLEDLNLGSYGNNLIGKAITIFPETEELALTIAEFLIAKSNGLNGPEVITDFPLSPILFVRYGSFSPLIMTDIYGNKGRYIYDGNGNVMKDEYVSPPCIPTGINNIFSHLIKPLPISIKKNSIGEYFPLKVLKNDVKGVVLKALQWNKFRLKYCLIKQGKRYMVNEMIEDKNRDMRDRILWQKAMHQKLQKLIPIPAIYSLFEENGNMYLAMEFIKKNMTFSSICHELLEDRPWFGCSLGNRVLLLGYFEQIISSIKSIHQNGYIHRDITPTNFLVSKRKKVYLIDVELMYDTNSKMPDPPFKVGTFGYMSPEQVICETPSVSDDIYSIGALLIFLMTGIAPSFIIETDRRNLSEKLFFLIRDNGIVTMILDCLEPIKELRLEIDQIQSGICNYKESLVSLDDRNDSIQEVGYSKEEIFEVAKRGTLGIQDDIMLLDCLWFSKYNDEYNESLNPLGTKAIYSDLYRGIGGTLYFLNVAKKCGLNYCINQTLKNHAQEHLIRECLNDMSQTVPGLYFGTAGIALVMSQDSDSWLQNGTVLSELALQCLKRESPLLDLIHGIAGQGIAALQCDKLLTKEDQDFLLFHYASKLISYQRKDGSWVKSILDQGTLRGEKIPGFGYGTAGIVYFLLMFGYRYQFQPALDSAIRGLDYLMAIARKKDEHYYWYNSDQSKLIRGWWCHGAPGIALTFIKAYELLMCEKYKKLAEGALRINHFNFVNYNLSQCHGMSGLGEIYLEAFRVFRSEEWLKRATWITELLVSMKRINNNTNHYYWLASSPEFPTADFMAGNSGIVHYLLHYTHLDKVGFPFLPF
jgi:serine/threonine protein kinase